MGVLHCIHHSALQIDVKLRKVRWSSCSDDLAFYPSSNAGPLVVQYVSILLSDVGKNLTLQEYVFNFTFGAFGKMKVSNILNEVCQYELVLISNWFLYLNSSCGIPSRDIYTVYFTVSNFIHFFSATYRWLVSVRQPLNLVEVPVEKIEWHSRSMDVIWNCYRS